MKHLHFFAAIVLTILVFAPRVTAQEKPTAELIILTDKIDPGYTINCVSDSGKYFAGNCMEPGMLFIYNVEKEVATYINEAGMKGLRVMSVTDDGTIVGAYGANELYQPALWKDGKWTLLPLPTDMNYYGSACAMTTKGDIITGWILGGPKGDACVWRVKDGKYEFEILPSEKDWNDEVPSWVTAYDISADGKVVTGTMCDSNGSYYLPCSWTRNATGQYEQIQLHGLEICFNLNETKPGPMPEYNDYVTAPMGTPQQAEQIAAFNDATEAWKKLLNKYTTDKRLNGRSSSVSANGEYFSAYMTMPNPNTGWERNMTIPVRINTTDGTITVFKSKTENGVLLEQAQAQATNNEGVTFAISPLKGIVQTWVYTDTDAAPVEMYKWLKSKYELDITSQLSFDFPLEDGAIATDTTITGAPFISSDQNVIAFSVMHPETGTGFISYYIKITNPSAIQSNTANGKISLYAAKNILHIDGDAEKISISDMSGKTVYQSNTVERTMNVARLSQGIYIVRLTAGGNDHVYKVVLTD